MEGFVFSCHYSGRTVLTSKILLRPYSSDYYGRTVPIFSYLNTYFDFTVTKLPTLTKINKYVVDMLKFTCEALIAGKTSFDFQSKEKI